MLLSILKFNRKEDTSRLERFRTIVVNVISIPTSLIVFLYMILFVQTGLLFMAGLFLIFTVLSILPLYTNKLGYYVFSRVLIISITISIIYFTVLLVGFQSQVHTILVILVACIPLLFDQSKIAISLVVAIILLFFFSDYYLHQYGPIYPSAEIKFSNFINFSFAILASTLFSSIIINEVRLYIGQIQESNDLLKQNNNELTEKNEQIELQNKSLELFTSVAAHDLRTPVRTISSFSGLIERKLGKANNPDPKLNEYLQYIKTGTKQLSELINSISNVNRLQHESSSEVKTLDLNQVLEEVKFHFNKELYSKFEIIAEPLPHIKGDKTHFYNLFQNLIENSWKYNKNEIKKLKISLTKNLKFFIISFEDNGIGIDASYADQIFKPFTKLHSNLDYEGSGMGLAICKRIVEMYGGKIAVESKNHVGSVFVINFPISLIVSESNIL